ncbi:MAG: redoxin domain-containing protein [Bdellovibrionales bacterium]
MNISRVTAKIALGLTLNLMLMLSFGAASLALTSVSGKDLLADKSIEVKPGSKGTVLVFMSAKCPCSNNHVGVLKKLAADFKDFSFVAVHSNADESLDLSKSYFKAAELPFPVIQDEGGELADEFKALKTPHAFLLGPGGKILYKGGVTSSTHGESAERRLLRGALSDVDAGRKVRVAEGRTLGCAISRSH